MDSRYTRTVASAEGLGNAAKDRHRFLDKSVLLTGEPGTLQTPNGREIARAALLLLVRICPNIVVALPDACADIASELEDLALLIDPNTTVTRETLPNKLERYDAILSVGTRGSSTLPWTVINSNGWVARVSSRGHDIAASCEQPNAIGAVGAACLGVCDVFKRLIALTPESGELLNNICFSFWTYSAGSDEPGPALPTAISIEVLLVGAGAIGSGTAYLLSRLPVTGRALVIDRQNYEIENWGTCVCMSTRDVAREKAHVLASVLRSKLPVSGRKISIEKFRAELESANLGPGIVLDGLDEVDPRHEVQSLWPDLVIDGAVGSDFSCQVSCHPWGPDIACLKCLFRHSSSAVRWEQRVSQATGLPETFFAIPDSVISAEQLEVIAPEKRALLSQHVGKAWCSITPEDRAEIISGERLSEGFTPSVPFVACFSSCLIVTELVRRVLQGTTGQEPRFQLNLLWGPQRGTDFPQARRDDCECVTRAGNIERMRGMRQPLFLTQISLRPQPAQETG